MNILSDEIQNDPLNRSYSGMSNTAIQTDLNTSYRTINLSNLSGDLVFGTTDNSEFLALSDTKKEQWISFCARDSLDPFLSSNINFVKYIFGNDSNTVSTLLSVRTTNITRWKELGLRRLPSINEIGEAR